MKKYFVSDKNGNDLFLITFYNKRFQDKFIKSLSKYKKFLNIKEV